MIRYLLDVRDDACSDGSCGMLGSFSYKAHDTAIEAIILSKTGDFLATASETGTIIRFFNTKMINV